MANGKNDDEGWERIKKAGRKAAKDLSVAGVARKVKEAKRAKGGNGAEARREAIRSRVRGSVSRMFGGRTPEQFRQELVRGQREPDWSDYKKPGEWNPDAQ